MMEDPYDVSAPALPDEWEPAAPLRLDGWMERHGYPPVMTALFGLVLAFVLFQVVISPIAVVLLLVAQGIAPDQLLGSLENLVDEHAATLLTANTVGQILGLAVPAYLLARLHSSRPAAFLRYRPGDLRFVGLGVLGLIALTPAIQWLGIINEQFPLPEFIRSFEESQIELIERVLEVDTGILFNLIVLAVTPAICEEMLFRGYVQRQAERGMGITGGILFSGIIFGVYHLRLTQVVPLCVLGIYLAWLVWRTGSLWPAIAVHFANNAIAIAIGAYISQRPELEARALEQWEVPWHYVVLGMVVFGAAVVAMQRIAERLLQHARASKSGKTVHALNPDEFDE